MRYACTMKTKPGRHLVVVLLGLLLAPAAFADPRPAGAATLGWLAGEWRMDGDTRVEEHWTTPEGGKLIGMGRTVAGGKTVFFEYLRIEDRADGTYYVAQPLGRPPTDFKLVRATASEAVFENPAHDFPKRIHYRREADGTLVARVEGDPGDKEKAEEFRYRSVKPR
jgi:hypothetical protein